MLRSLRRLRQPRYLALTALMLVIAALCAALGTWQVARYRESVRTNDALTANAGMPSVPLAAMRLPVAGSGTSPDALAIRFRRVSVGGSYLGTTSFVRKASVDDQNGFFVLSPLRTGSTVLLVVRGFVASDGAPPRTVAAPPTGTVQLTGRLATASTDSDAAGRLPDAQLESINPAEQAARLGSPVYDAYLGLDAKQPGADGLTELPAPDLSNPAGGAYEWQHLAYVVQWYAFALLALAAPLMISRREVREAQRNYLGIDPDELPDDADEPAALPAGSGPSGTIALRGKAELAHRTPEEQERIRRAAALADRYGHRLEVPDGVSLRPRRRRPAAQDERTAAGLSRSADDYHGAYNDHLWQLAMADGDIPPPDVPDAKPQIEPVVIDLEED